jgi:GST-like protein
LAPEVVGEDPMFSELIFEKMYNGSRVRPALERGVAQAETSRRNGMVMEAISGVDIAVWDVKAKAMGIPIYQALGAVRSAVRGYASGGWAPGNEAEAELGGYASKGFTAAKMRVVGRDGFSIENCVRRVEAARRGIGPNVELMVDAHASLETPVAIRLAKALEPYNIAWFEEPVSPDNHAGMAEVRASTRIPIASGEREFSRYGFKSMLEHKAIDIAQPDVARSGGLTEIRRIAALTHAYDIRLAPHAWGSGVLFAASLHVALSAANCHILEVSQGYMPMMNELFNEPYDIRNGYVHAPDRRGWALRCGPTRWSGSNMWTVPSSSFSGSRPLHFSVIHLSSQHKRRTMIELHSSPTPNGQKVMIMLEETGLEWKHFDINIRLGEQFTPEFLKKSPNNKIPTIVDSDGPGGKPYTMMESGAILFYLAEKTGKFLPKDARKRYDVMQWLIFQMAHVGPMFGQANHFNNYVKENTKDPQQYAQDRYNNESLRIYRVIDNRARDSAWMGCDEYSIADMAIYPWTKMHKDRGVSEADYPNFMRWYKAMEARPAVQRNNKMATEIRERMAKAAEGKQAIKMYDTKDNAERLAKATSR